MKKLLNLSSLICLLFILISCSNNKSETASTSTANSTDSSSKSQAAINKANTEKVFRGIESGDMSAMDEFVSVDIIDHGAPGGDVKGLDSVKKMLGDMHNHFSNLKMELIADATDGDYQFTLVRMSGTTKDNAMGMPPNTPVAHTNVGVVRIVNGKAVEHWLFVDPKVMMQKPASDKNK